MGISFLRCLLPVILPLRESFSSHGTERFFHFLQEERFQKWTFARKYCRLATERTPSRRFDTPVRELEEMRLEPLEGDD